MTMQNWPQVEEFMSKFSELPIEQYNEIYTAVSCAWLDGAERGLTAYSWMKSGVTYVGTCGETLKEAKEKLRSGKLWL